MNALQKYKIIQVYLEGQISLSTISLNHEIPIRTLRRWVQKYREQELNGLKRKERKDKNCRRKIDSELIAVVEALFLQKPKLSISNIHRKVKQIAQQKNKSIPSYGVVYDITCKMNPALLTLAHEGSTAYREKYEIIFRRESSFSNEMWQIDHCFLDIFLVHEKEGLKKPWLTIMIDDCSRAISGFYLSFDAPCAVNTALALRQGIWRKSNTDWQVCGIPQCLYTDNGSDFISNHIEKVCASLKINLVHSIPGRPQGKGRVERFFLTLLQQFLQTLPNYIPSGSSKKAAIKDALTLFELSNLIEAFITKEYHHHVHSVTQKKPIEHWIGAGFLPQMPSSIDELDLLLLTVPILRKVHRDGIYFKRFRYMNVNLSAFVGERVMVRYDPRDIAEIRIFFKGTFICNAICQDIAGQVISLKEIKGTRQKEKRRLRKTIKEAKELLQNLEKESKQSPQNDNKPS